MMLALMAEREQPFPTAGRLPVAFRTLLRAKIRKIIQKTAFGEDINTVYAQKLFVLPRKPLYYVWE